VHRRRSLPAFAAGLGFALALGAATVPAAAAARPATYSVRQGDTFWSLSRELGTTVAALEAANPDVSALDLYPGLVLHLPGASGPAAPSVTSGSYTVRQGDTFWGLARRFGTTVATLEAANPKVCAWNLYPGLRLLMPGVPSLGAAPGEASFTARSGASGSFKAAASPGGAAISGGSGNRAGVPATQANIHLLARLAAAEEGNRSLQDQTGVDAVVLNRVASGQFPNTVSGVIFQAGQFTSVSNGYYFNAQVTSTSIQAAQDALAGADPTGGALYFYDPTQGITSSWIYSTATLTVIDGTVYSI
jgi:N-acetylmuramoyl-L-alanine amidase